MPSSLTAVRRIVDQRDVGRDLARRASAASSAARAPRRDRRRSGSSPRPRRRSRPRPRGRTGYARARGRGAARRRCGARRPPRGSRRSRSRNSRRSSCSGRPPFSASMLQPKLGLHRREAEQLVQHHVRRRVALQLDHDAHAEAVALVLDVGDALDPLVARQLGDALDHRRLVHLVGDLGDDDRRAGRARISSMRVRDAQDHRAAPLVVGLARAGAARGSARRSGSPGPG